MDPATAAALASWNFDPLVCLAIIAAAWLHWRGWRHLRQEHPLKYPAWRQTAFRCGLAALFLALASPLDALAGLLLEVHMIQHLLLIMIAPPLLWLGEPLLAWMRGLPENARRNGLGPFLRWRALQRFTAAITHPLVCWSALTIVIVVWHLPRFYELALRSSGWHEAEHTCFFYAAMLFWWPVIRPWPSRRAPFRWTVIPYLITADLVNTALSAAFIFSGQTLYPHYESVPRLWGISPLDDQARAGAIMWLPGSLAFLIAAVILAVGAINGHSAAWAPELYRVPLQPERKQSSAPWDMLNMRLIGRFLRFRHARAILQTFMLLLAAAIAADGLLGPQESPVNLAGVLPWIHWRAFTVLALLVAGNLFCMVCPFTLPRTIFRRFFPARYRWPVALRSKWVAAGILVIYLWAYEAFQLWDSPRHTAWIIIGYFGAAFFIDTLFQGASFCKYVCPIGQFHFIHSLISPLEIKIRKPVVCHSCRTFDCIRGNDVSRGCELALFQPRKAGNLDCTFCLDCIHACPHDNVGILPSAPVANLTQNRQRVDTAAIALILVFAAFFTAAAMTTPVMRWMHHWHATLGPRSMLLIITVMTLSCIAIVPFAAASGAAFITAAVWRQPGSSRWELTSRFVLSLIPLGLSMWVAHFWLHFFTGWRGAVAAFARLLALPGYTAAASLAPSWLPSLRILILDGGLLFTLWIAWRTASRYSQRATQALMMLAPWAAIAAVLYAIGIWILFQPMDMGGMAP